MQIFLEKTKANKKYTADNGQITSAAISIEALKYPWNRLEHINNFNND